MLLFQWINGDLDLYTKLVHSLVRRFKNFLIKFKFEKGIENCTILVLGFNLTFCK